MGAFKFDANGKLLGKHDESKEKKGEDRRKRRKVLISARVDRGRLGNPAAANSILSRTPSYGFRRSNRLTRDRPLARRKVAFVCARPRCRHFYPQKRDGKITPRFVVTGFAVADLSWQTEGNIPHMKNSKTTATCGF